MNSIGVVLRYRRQVGVVMTAAFVLLSHVYCACGGATRAPAAAGASQAASLPPCHRHAATPDQPDKRGSAPADRGGHSCQHCKPSTLASSAGQTPASELKPAPWPLTLGPLSTVAALAPSLARLASVSADLPPPLPCSTLLGLHCALNT